MKKGYIVLIPFPFSDLSGSKLRLMVVLTSTAPEATGSYVTSQILRAEGYDVPLTPTAKNRLLKHSLIRTRKISTVRKSFGAGEIGELDAVDLTALNVALKIVLQLP